MIQEAVSAGWVGVAVGFGRAARGGLYVDVSGRVQQEQPACEGRAEFGSGQNGGRRGGGEGGLCLDVVGDVGRCSGSGFWRKGDEAMLVGHGDVACDEGGHARERVRGVGGHGELVRGGVFVVAHEAAQA